MKVWNISENLIKQMYNSKVILIPANSIIELSDDCVVFLLGKKEVRGHGLVQVKDGDNKADRYSQGRDNMYKWSSEIYANYLNHCEERESIKLQPLKPHAPIVQAKQIIDDYEKWVENGRPVKEELKEVIGEKKVFVCPHCNKEHDSKIAYFGHLRSHKEDNNGINAVTVENKSKGKS